MSKMASQNSHPLPMAPGQSQQTYNQNFQSPSSQRYPPQVQYQQPQQPQQPQQHHSYQQQQRQQQPQQQQQRQQQNQQAGQQKPRPRSRGFSFRSEKSHKSSGSNGKINLHETSSEKEAKRLHTKADPSVAMNEAEPATIQAQAKTLLAPLRGIQHKDSFGNPIADPDRSNPTRSRWERPLDTIRSFEAAIDGGYNRKSYIRSADSDSPATWNRRSSQYGTNGGPSGSGGRFHHDSYYGGRPQSTANFGSQHDQRQQRESYFGDGSQGGHTNAYSPGPNGPSQRRYPRMPSESQHNSPRAPDPNIYPIANNHRSYETVASASGSGTSGEAGGYQTDLTSDNSSGERVQAPQRRRQDPVNDYGIGFNQTPESQPAAFTVGVKSPGMNAAGQPQSGYQNDGAVGYNAPSVPQKGGMLRKQSTNTAPSTATPEQRPGVGDKRKSWFTRKFSKQQA